MRHWLFHPLIFYPLAIFLAAAAIVVSLRPQSWPREPAPVTADRDGEWMVYERNGFNSPDEGAEAMTVVRDYWGRPLRLQPQALVRPKNGHIRALPGGRACGFCGLMPPSPPAGSLASC